MIRPTWDSQILLLFTAASSCVVTVVHGTNTHNGDVVHYCICCCTICAFRRWMYKMVLQMMLLIMRGNAVWMVTDHRIAIARHYLSRLRVVENRAEVFTPRWGCAIPDNETFLYYNSLSWACLVSSWGGCCFFVTGHLADAPFLLPSFRCLLNYWLLLL